MIEIPAVLITGLQGFFRKVRFVKITGKASEQLCHCKVRFRMSDIDGRIDQNGMPVFTRHAIAAPEISVQKRRRFRPGQKLIQMIETMPSP